MKKILTFALVALACSFSVAFAASSASVLTHSEQFGNLVSTRSLAGNKLTESTCIHSQDATGAHAQCVSKVQKLTKRQAREAEASILQAGLRTHANVAASGGRYAESAPQAGATAAADMPNSLSERSAQRSQFGGAALKTSAGVSSPHESGISTSYASSSSQDRQKLSSGF